MRTERKFTYEELQARLLEAENLLDALRHREVDGIVGDEKVAPVRPREADETREKAYEELERRVVERTAELARANRKLQEIIEQQKREIQSDREQLRLLTEELMALEEQQRRQIAQVLHDTVGQSLAFSKRELNLLRQRGPQEIGGVLQDVCQQLDDAIKQTRDLMFELSPATLYQVGLQPALEELAEQFAESERFHCRVVGPGECGPLSEQMRSLLYRAVRELLVNVAKHAHAKNVEIVLNRDEQGLQIAVQDDGKGFDPTTLRRCGRSYGFGILSVRERLIRIGGAFVLESQEGRGTKVTMSVPVDLGQRSDLWG